MYNANISVECIAEGENNEYYTITPTIDGSTSTVVEAKTEKSGNIIVTLIKTPSSEIEEAFTCTLTSNAEERTSVGVEPEPKIVLTFDGMGGTDYTVEKDAAGEIGELPVPEKEGYTFTGWYTAESGGEEITIATAYSANTTYYAHWTANPYTLTFDGNGGSDGTAITKNCGEEIGDLPTSTRDGYTFLGWYTQETGGTKIEATTKVPTKATTYYAHWEEIDYTITFNGNGGDNAPSITRHYNEEIGTLPTIQRDGYSLVGWYTETTGGEEITSTTKVTENKTYYAHWETIYTVTYNYAENGGSSTTGATQQPSVGSAIDLTPTATKTGYSFVGWNTDKDATTKLNSLAMPSSNVVLYAIFRKEITITFNKNGAVSQTVSGGSASTAAEVTDSCYMYNNASNCSIISPSIEASANTPTVIGYSLSADTHTSSWDENTVKLVNADVIYYAQTSKTAEVVTAHLTKDDTSVASITSDTVSCTIEETFNGVAQATSCTASGSSIDFTPKSGYAKLGWFLSTNSTDTPDVEVGDSFTLVYGTNVTYIAKGEKHVAFAYTYNQTSGASNYCVTGDETTCQETECYKNKTAESCPAGTIINYPVNNSKTVRFHVMYDDGNTMTLQSQRNTVKRGYWMSESDYVKAGGTSSDYTEFGNNDKGPITMLNRLETATEDWINVNDQTYEMGTTVFKTNAYTTCSCGEYPSNCQCNANGYTLPSRTAKARMITVQEAITLGCKYENDSCPAWMFNYSWESWDVHSGLSSDPEAEDGYSNRIRGYWTMSAH